MPNFIYVFSEEGRDILLQMKYDLLKSDDIRHVYIFKNKDRMEFACAGIPYSLSDILTF